MKLTKVILQVPYFASTFVILGVFIHPCVSSFLCTDMLLLVTNNTAVYIELLNANADKEHCIQKSQIQWTGTTKFVDAEFSL